MAVNSALEVDLSGQIGAELRRGVYVGAAGGQADFSRAAAWPNAPAGSPPSPRRSTATPSSGPLLVEY